MAEWMMFGILVGFSMYDLKWRKVNVAAVVLLGVAVFIYRICISTEAAELMLGMVPGLVVLLVSYVTGESIGFGDGMMLCVLGLFFGIKQTLAVFGMALVLCAVLAILLLVCKRANKKTELPFLPCLCAGYLLSLLW